MFFFPFFHVTAVEPRSAVTAEDPLISGVVNLDRVETATLFVDTFGKVLICATFDDTMSRARCE